MVGTDVVSPIPQQTKDVASKKSSTTMKSMSFTNPTEVWDMAAKQFDMVTKQLDTAKLKNLGQETLTKGSEVAGKMGEKVNNVKDYLMTTAREHPYAFVMSLLLSGLASMFVGSFLMLTCVWMMVLAGVVAAFTMVGFVVFAAILMTTWALLFTTVSSATAVYLPYIFYMGLEPGWFNRMITFIKDTNSMVLGEVHKIVKTVFDFVMEEATKLQKTL